MKRFQDVFAGGWIAAAPFVLLGAPDPWPWLALVMGAFIAWVYSRPDANSIAGGKG